MDFVNTVIIIIFGIFLLLPKLFSSKKLGKIIAELIEKKIK